jgi:acyl-[acyl-carrier-protein]-phospholipid O-acyltransferase / long-chain-fatty-acid--[acyl-carrier-protein] ligase
MIQAILAAVFRIWFGLEARGIEHVREVGPRAVIVANHTSFVDALLLAAVLPRRTLFAIDTRRARSWYGRIAGLFFELFPMDPLNPFSTKTLIREVAGGRHCVIFPEGRITQTGALMKIYEGPGLIADKADAPVVPVRIAGAQYSIFSRLRGKVRIRLFPKVEVTALPARRFAVTPELKGRKRRHAVGAALYDIMSAMMFETERQAVSLYAAMLDARHTHGGRAPVFEDIERAPMDYDGLVLASTILGRKLSRHAGRGQALGLLLPNANALAATFMACQAEGIVPAMLNYTAGAAGILSAIAAAKIDTIVTARVFIERARLESVVGQLASTVRVLYLEDIRQSVTPLEKLAGLALRPFAAMRHRRRRVDQDGPAVILFTSGTEGTPKGVALSHRNLLANARQIAARIDFTSSDRVFNALPLFHSFGMTGGLVLPMLAGIKTFLYPSPLHYRIVPEMIYDTSATIMFGTDTFLAGYARAAHPYDFYAMRYVFAGAERVHDETRARWMEKFGLRILEGYGVTECSPVIAVNTPMHFKPGTVGRALPDVECRLEPVPGIANGARLHVRGPNVMLGYLKVDRPGEIQRPEGGWHDTGDIIDAAEFSATGFIRVLGRARRFAKIAGEMVSLGAVEAMIQARWPGAQHAVLPLPDPRKGEQLVLLTTARDVTRPELTVQAQSAGLPELWVPKEIFPVDAMPLLGTGKTDYVAARVLAERLAGVAGAA